MAIVKCRMLVPKFMCLDNVNMQYPKVNGFSGADNVLSPMDISRGSKHDSRKSLSLNYISSCNN